MGLFDRFKSRDGVKKYRRSIWLDKDPRSKVATKLIKWIVIAVLITGYSIYGIVTGVGEYKEAVATSSTNYGASLQFTRSNANWQVGHVYTDKNQDMLVVQLKSNNQADVNLPANGDAYKVYIADKNAKYGHVPIAFGRYGTDGDMYLFIPNPRKDYVYTIFVMNTQYLQQSVQENDKTGSSGTDIADIGSGTATSSEEKSITNILSQNSDNNSQGVPNYKVANDYSDLVAFRVTLNSNKKYTEANKTITLKNPLVTNGTLNFANFFNETLQQNTLNTLQTKLDNYNKQLPALQKTEKEYQSRLQANPNDQNAKTSLDSVQQNIQSLQGDIQTAKSNIAQYKKATFKPEQFSNIQTVGIVTNTW